MLTVFPEVHHHVLSPSNHLRCSPPLRGASALDCIVKHFNLSTSPLRRQVYGRGNGYLAKQQFYAILLIPFCTHRSHELKWFLAKVAQVVLVVVAVDSPSGLVAVLTRVLSSIQPIHLLQVYLINCSGVSLCALVKRLGHCMVNHSECIDYIWSIHSLSLITHSLWLYFGLSVSAFDHVRNENAHVFRELGARVRAYPSSFINVGRQSALWWYVMQWYL